MQSLTRGLRHHILFYLSSEKVSWKWKLWRLKNPHFSLTSINKTPHQSLHSPSLPPPRKAAGTRLLDRPSGTRRCNFPGSVCFMRSYVTSAITGDFRTVTKAGFCPHVNAEASMSLPLSGRQGWLGNWASSCLRESHSAPRGTHKLRVPREEVFTFSQTQFQVQNLLCIPGHSFPDPCPAQEVVLAWMSVGKRSWFFMRNSQS